MIIEPVVAQHTEEAAFLWLLRDAAVGAPHYLLWELAQGGSDLELTSSIVLEGGVLEDQAFG